MPTPTRAVLVAPALALLTACGGGGTSPSSFEDRVREGDELLARVQALAPTAFEAMPTAGRASFTGIGGLIIDRSGTGADDIGILGDAALTANFGAGTVTGSVTNMQGLLIDDVDSTGNFAVAGRVNIGNIGSQIGPDPDDRPILRPNGWRANYGGQISMSAGTFDVSGVMDGQFLGTRVNNPTKPAIKAISGVDEDGVAVRGDGREFGLGFEVVAEN